MSTNRVEGAAKKASGAIKETAGKVTGNDRLRAKGMAEKTAGGVQNKIGKAQDKAGAALRR
ncbi:MAG TPA: CsbD family protein [Caulobacteraceae bacterium]|nr:CsbD family protein [Caulobacteraceae bacterium]